MKWFKKNVYLPLPISRWEQIIKFVEENKEREFEYKVCNGLHYCKIYLETSEFVYAENILELADKIPTMRKLISAKKELKK